MSLLWLQVQTLPPVVIWWAVHHVHKYSCRAVRGTHTDTYTQNTTLNLNACVFQSAAAAPSPVMGNMPPNDAMPGGPMPPGFFQVWLSPSVAVLLTPPSLHLLQKHPDLSLYHSSISDSSKTNQRHFRQYLHILWTPSPAPGDCLSLIQSCFKGVLKKTEAFRICLPTDNHFTLQLKHQKHQN